MFVSLSDFSTVPVLFSRCQQKRARRRVGDTLNIKDYSSSLLRRSWRLSPMLRHDVLRLWLQFIELPFQLVDQFVNCGVLSSCLPLATRTPLGVLIVASQQTLVALWTE